MSSRSNRHPNIKEALASVGVKDIEGPATKRKLHFDSLSSISKDLGDPVIDICTQEQRYTNSSSRSTNRKNIDYDRFKIMTSEKISMFDKDEFEDFEETFNDSDYFYEEIEVTAELD
mmetsp:Transcript_11416/g.10074  ORF Transcript_11416/g.10074 Transcript_11416/m.10074 type:complete len:117 (+) Transcript_11416:287-637(+)